MKERITKNRPLLPWTTPFASPYLSLGLAAALVAFACTDESSSSLAPSASSSPADPDAPAPPPSSSSPPSSDAGSGETGSPLPNDGGTEAEAGHSCPTGSTLRHVRTACSGALTPPASLSTAITSATPGAIVSLGGMNEGTAPCLPVLVCTPADAPTLLFSDSPESPATDGVLYADTTIANGRYRLYVYQANGGTALRKFPVVVLNQGAQDAKVTIVRRGLAAPSTNYVSVGKTVLLDWLVDRPPVDVTVPAGSRVLLDPALDGLHAEKFDLVHAIYDVVTSAPLKISFVTVGANANAVTATAGLSLLARDLDHQRGTFAAADVLVTLAGPQVKGVQRLRLGLGEVDATMEGIDAPTGDKQKLLGNYGMLYRFALGFPSPTRAAIAPRGGSWGGVMKAGTTSIALPMNAEVLGTTTDAIVLGSPATETRLMTAGGSNLPVDLFFVTP